jgi:hypothetical protein
MQTSSAATQKTLVPLLGVRGACPPGCVRVSRDDQVSVGSFFVHFKPARDVGPWASEARERPWCVAIRRQDGTAERGFFGSLDLAVKRARRLNARLAS